MKKRRLNKKDSIESVNKRMRDKLPKQRHDAGHKVCNIIDGMGLVHAAHNAYSKLSFQGNSTAVIFGVPQMIKSTLQRFKSDKTIIAWDGVKHPKRMELLPGYKEHRLKSRDPKERELMEKEILRLRKLLYYMGIPQAYDPKVEGDDMLYFVYKQMILTHRINIISGDKDFNQLINHDCQVYNPRTNDIHGTFAFTGEHSIEVPQFVDYLCLVGDKSDDIPGYYGFGPATAIKFFKQFYSIKEYLDSDKVFTGLTDKEKVAEIYKRNRRLIDLRLFCKKYYPEDYQITYYKDQQFPEFNEDKYREVCIKRNLKTMLYPGFMDIFKNL